MVNAVCVYKPGKGFTQEYVLRLREALQKQKVEHRFICLTTDRDLMQKLPNETIPIWDTLPGWWNKMFLFRPFLFKGRVVYMDLDTVLPGDISPLLSYEGEFPLFLDDFNDKGQLATGVMAWEAGQLDHIYREFIANPQAFIDKYDHGARSNRGDQALVRALMVDHAWMSVQEIQPGVCSYKIDILKGRKENVHLVAFHGKPRPHEVNWKV